MKVKSKKDINLILSILNEMYPEARCALNYNTPFQLLIATVLSAQTTDKKVNEVTKKLFDKYPTSREFVKATQEELEQYIREIGLYRTKAKHILSLSNSINDEYNGEVPKTMEELVKLSGVGRKTANVVLSNAFGVPAIAVDTHVFRVSNRIGLAASNNVEGTEMQLMDIIPKEQWTKTHHLIIFHGRNICIARNPKCDICNLKGFCDFYKGKV